MTSSRGFADFTGNYEGSRAPDIGYVRVQTLDFSLCFYQLLNLTLQLNYRWVVPTYMTCFKTVDWLVYRTVYESIGSFVTPASRPFIVVLIVIGFCRFNFNLKRDIPLSR